MVISLIGYRATGKTTVGQQLAARLGWDFVDIDREIEQTAGKSIAAIFAEDGELRFRELEREELSRQLSRNSVVVSPGGGAILDEQSRERLRQAGPVIWLQAQVETIVRRLQQDATTTSSRPSLTGQGIVEEVASVLSQRSPLYTETASLMVDTEDRSITAIVDEIVSRVPAIGGQRW